MMTSKEKLQMLSVMTGEEDKNILSTYLKLAEGKVLGQMYPFHDADFEDVSMPEKYDLVQVEIAAFMIMKIGAEGELHHDENGVLRIYENADIPSSIMSKIMPMSKVVI